MINFLKKLGFSLIVFAFFTLNNAVFAAASLDQITEALTSDPCISEEERNSYVITIIEEPLSNSESGTTGEEYISRMCYRNTVLVKTTDADGSSVEEIHAGLLKKCANELSGDGVTLYCQQVQALLSKGGTSLIEGYISTIYKWGASVAGIIAVLVIIISAMQIAISGGDSQAVEAAKKRILQSIGGLAVLFLSGVILYTINPTFFTRG